MFSFRREENGEPVGAIIYRTGQDRTGGGSLGPGPGPGLLGSRLTETL